MKKIEHIEFLEIKTHNKIVKETIKNALFTGLYKSFNNREKHLTKLLCIQLFGRTPDEIITLKSKWDIRVEIRKTYKNIISTYNFIHKLDLNNEPLKYNKIIMKMSNTKNINQ